MALGRVEENGIRCLYHGWKFGVDGRLQDVPNCSLKAVRETVKARAYPVREEGGLVWAYLGPPGQAAVIHPLCVHGCASRPIARSSASMSTRTICSSAREALTPRMSESCTATSRVRAGCMLLSPRIPDKLNPAVLAVEDNDPELELRETDFGYYYAAFRRAEKNSSDGKVARWNVRIVPFIMPSTRIICFADESVYGV